jgi:hypothetical protein
MAEQEKSKGHSTTHGYFVEARMSDASEPWRLGHTWLTTEWRHISWEKSSSGSGVKSHLFNPLANDHGMLTYEAAHALIATAAADRALANIFVDFRLRKVEMVCEWCINDKGVGRTVNFMADERAEEFEAAPTTGEGDET